MEAMASRWLIVLGALALGLVVGGCASDGKTASGETQDRGPLARRSNEARLIESTVASCAVGERPGYFVPGPADSPLALLGCARLGVSGKRVEFSGNLALIDDGLYACVNPAYSGRGGSGAYIPAICKLEPPLSEFAVRDAGQPRQAARGYAYVIWGTAGASTKVVAGFTGGTVQAAVLTVGPELAREFGEPPFSLYVMELPLSAACAAVTVAGDGSDASERIPRQRKLCKRAQGGTSG